MPKKKGRLTTLLVPPRGPARNLRPAGVHDDQTAYDRKKQKAALRREIAESGFPRLGAALCILGLLAACSGGGPAREALPAQPAALRAPAAKAIAISGTGSNPSLDKSVVAFMTAQQVPNAELAVSSGGKTIFSHAYTYRSLAASTTTTKTIMRLASNSKAWVDAALYNLISAKKISPSAKVFAYLGIKKPLPANGVVDPRVYTITIQNMIDHESGWDDSVPPYYDPTFGMRESALALGLTHEINQTQYVQHGLTMPLQEAPGTTYAYCNFCYTVLGMVVAKASGKSFADYIAKEVAAPMHLKNVFLSPTAGKRLKGEVAKYYSSLTGLSAINVTSSKLVPNPYGGDDMSLEVAQGSGAIATTAESELTFMNKYIIWGVGKPQPGADWAREGSMDGTNTWAEQLANGKNYAFLINTRQYSPSTPTAFTDLQTILEGILNK